MYIEPLQSTYTFQAHVALVSLTRVKVLSRSKLSRRTDSWKLQSSSITEPDPNELL
jgi:hypothetical protein